MEKVKNRLVIASTTSTQNSGLFDILIPAYEKFSKYQVKVEVIAVSRARPSGWLRRERRMSSSYTIPFVKKNLSLKGMGSIAGR